MKKFTITLLIFIAILFIVLLLKMNGLFSKSVETGNFQTPKTNTESYSSEDIKKLILQGKDNLNNMENVYYESGTKSFTLSKIYYKGAKMKDDFYHPLYPNEKTRSTIIRDGKKYYINYETKSMRISQARPLELPYGFQSVILRVVDYSPSCEFTYLRDETLDNKDCILVKRVYSGTSNYDKTEVYWLEKSTGFLIGWGYIKPNENEPTIGAIYRNITLGTVQESDFEIPTGYRTEFK